MTSRVILDFGTGGPSVSTRNFDVPSTDSAHRYDREGPMNSSEEAAGQLASLWRYPVKSMLGEELDASDLTERGLLGDRSYALLDPSTGMVVSAKNPRKWARMFEFRAEYVESPRTGQPLPPVRITCPDGAMATSDVSVRISSSSQSRGRTDSPRTIGSDKFLRSETESKFEYAGRVRGA